MKEWFFAPLIQLTRDLVAFAGWHGLRTLTLVLAGAVVEGVSLLLFLPFFAIIIHSEAHAGASWAQAIVSRAFDLFSAESRIAKLIVLTASFAALMLARAFIITAREVATAELGVGFVQELRSRVTRRIAAA